MRFCFVLIFLLTFTIHGQRSHFTKYNFKKADSVAFTLKGESLNNLPVLTHQLTANFTKEVEKFRAIYTWVCTNIENDYTSYLKTSKKRKRLAHNTKAFMEWNNSMTPKVFERLRKERKTACTGYAYLIKEMASLAGLDCKIISGYGRTPTIRLREDSTPNHSWNRVKLNGIWYLCDATWSAGKIIIANDIPKFERNYFDGYFLASPSLFTKNHYPLQKEAFLLASPPDFKTFLEGPVIYKGAFKYDIIPQLPKQMHLTTAKKGLLSFQISVPDNFTEKELTLMVSNGISTSILYPKTIKNGNKLTLTTKFEKVGLFDVHIKFNDTLLATYVVKVKRK